MLTKEHRLRSNSDISRVYRRGQYGSSGGGVLSVKAASSGRAVTRAVVVVSKKVSKRAVVRNRLRRRCIEMLKSQWQTLAPGYDIVISVHVDVSELPATALTEHLTRALTRAGVNQKP